MTAGISKELLGRISDYVAQRTGLYFPETRWQDLERSLGDAARDFGFEDAEACARWLLLSPLTKRQIEALARRLTVGETYFFRDSKGFDLLEEKVLPELIHKRRESGKYLRIWSAGCASGEEPYSIAILLRRLIPDIGDWNITILASDINTSFLEKAEKGIYGEWSFRDVPAWVRQGFFRNVGKGRFELLPELRKGVTFFYHNLAEDAYPSLANHTNALDLILCRNVLMYFSDENQREVVRKFHRCLVNGGWLMVGPAEMSATQSSSFLPAQFSGAALYRKDIVSCRVPAEEERADSGQRMSDSGVPPFKEQSELPTPLHGDPGIPPLAVLPVSKEQADPYGEALKLYERGCYPEAEEKVSALLAADGGNGPALALLSRICANQGQLEEARDLCERAVAADRLNPAYYYLHAAVLSEMGQEDESKTCLTRALYLDQNFVLAHFALGNLARRKGMKREGERHFENALSILRTYLPDAIVPESEGMTAERMIEIISAALPEKTSA